MRDGELDLAEAALKDLVRAHSNHPLADSALYDLARLSVRRGQRSDALRYVDLLLRRDRDEGLIEPASWLRCSLVPAADRDECNDEFRSTFPDSPHTREAPAGEAPAGEAP